MTGTTRRSVLLLLSLAASAAVLVDGGSNDGGEDKSRAHKRDGDRQKRFLSMFQIVRFENGVCEADDNRNGTCYTSEECDQRGGSSSGSCADGFGVCCSFLPKCGESTSEEVSYLSSGEDDDATDQGSCVYSICKSSPSICRIRLDFESFTIDGPTVGTAIESGASITLGGAIGDCAKDTFTLSSPGGVGSPVICGFNTGQHIIVDASDQCSKAAFSIGSSPFSRSWDIKVTQHVCGSDEAGPPGCLQYHTETSGVISSFNFDAPTGGPIEADATHLSNQHYDICFRREKGMGCICFVQTDKGEPLLPDNQGSFGLSISSSDTASEIGMGSFCTSDYIRLPGAFDKNVASREDLGALCGRIGTIDTPICSNVVPFKVTFHTDADEVTTHPDDPQKNELAMAPAGILGFRLEYQQYQSCP